jgi:hypothetical protein
MGLIVRIDVDRPYGREPVSRHILSRLSSDFYLPQLGPAGYLRELETILKTMNAAGAAGYLFFRKCTYPSDRVMDLIAKGGHTIGLHLEDSRRFETFLEEKKALETRIGAAVLTCSKHGSGGGKFGRRHYPPYEPEKYIDWAKEAGLKALLGNLENPMLPPERHGDVCFYPSAFWLEPSWRDTRKFTVEWLKTFAAQRDVVFLIHPENVLADRQLTTEFSDLLTTLKTAKLA